MIDQLKMLETDCGFQHFLVLKSSKCLPCVCFDSRLLPTEGTTSLSLLADKTKRIYLINYNTGFGQAKGILKIYSCLSPKFSP